ncbi:MAG: HAD-IIA family hydrolase [Candidatus Heimdallarchaeum endolithica]|uniref:HAD-IIA family hydrolase n=1 Tax=Candidatus Heimdallarchaeum endolithica TaxID=2876572 RepID=A0A9Y1BT90_9ARCH|nr:MAG: HAD-IIA family hydrolase [Candidatus Heimdallarchaeum endolithica]
MSSDFSDKLLQFEAFFFDGDGVLYKENTILPGAKELLTILEEKKKKIFVLTNNSTKTREEYVEKLRNFGINVNINQILTSAYLTAKYVSETFPRSKIYVIGEQGLKQELERFNLEVLNNWEEKDSEDPFDFELRSVDIVITGMDRKLTYVKLARAMNILKNKQVRFIGTNADVTFPTPFGFIPGGGAMIDILEKLSNRKIDTIIGKPKPLMFNEALKSASVKNNETIMFGDRLETDIVGAKNVGINACFVLGGASSLSDLEKIAKTFYPDIITNSLSDLVHSL